MCAGSVEPCRDLDIIHHELLKKDIALIKGKVDQSRKNVERGLGGKEAKEEFAVLEKVGELFAIKGLQLDSCYSRWKGYN